jgi:hypothetical protein
MITGIKAHDLPCYLCDECHKVVDANGQWAKETYNEGLYQSVLWLLQTGNLEVK